MKIEFSQQGELLFIQATGRLDATWAEYFADTLLGKIREGQHCLVVNAAQMDFLSSAGIRSLMQVYKELSRVNGRFAMIHPSPFVEQTLSCSGLGMWLEAEWLDELRAALPVVEQQSQSDKHVQFFTLHEETTLQATVPAMWRPWHVVEPDNVQKLSFPSDTFALGIGTPVAATEQGNDMYGEFLAVGGNVVFQPPQEKTPADYLIAEEQFVPELQCAQAVYLQGQMSHMMRFSPTDTEPEYPLSALLDMMLEHTQGSAVGFVILAEIEGLVGATMIQSPGKLGSAVELGFPQIKDWLSFCGERSHVRQQALITGVAALKSGPLVPALPDHDNAPRAKAAHMHAAVFPYQPLQNGQLNLHETVARFFAGAPPLTIMHLVDDNRPLVGLGESALTRGACWFGAVANPEVLA